MSFHLDFLSISVDCSVFDGFSKVCFDWFYHTVCVPVCPVCLCILWFCPRGEVNVYILFLFVCFYSVSFVSSVLSQEIEALNQ